VADRVRADQADHGGRGPYHRPGQEGGQLIRSFAHRLGGDAAGLPDEGGLASFERATTWLNSAPLTPAGLRGRVVLVDFWTYTCVNWLRTLPYIRAWAHKYADDGLTVVGVHTPEFGFEHDVENVVRQSAALGVDWPVAVDNDYGVWRAFANHFWPALYLADADGRLRYHHFGEGEYAMSEMAIQQLLRDGGATDLKQDLVTVEPQGLEVVADWRTLQSAETYVGYGQSSGFAQQSVAAFDQPREYAAVPLRLNEWALAGSWTVARHAGISDAAGARIAFRFQARDVNLVMSPARLGNAIPFRVRLDGQPPAGANGGDADTDGGGVLDEQRTYQLIRQRGPIDERVFEIEFLAAGAEAYCFTFG
jgi:thiol-disulfide isomerase/thioredoxin